VNNGKPVYQMRQQLPEQCECFTAVLYQPAMKGYIARDWVVSALFGDFLEKGYVLDDEDCHHCVLPNLDIPTDHYVGYYVQAGANGLDGYGGDDIKNDFGFGGNCDFSPDGVGCVGEWKDDCDDVLLRVDERNIDDGYVPGTGYRQCTNADITVEGHYEGYSAALIGLISVFLLLSLVVAVVASCRCCCR